MKKRGRSLGYKMSEETKAKISAAMTNNAAALKRETCTETRVITHAELYVLRSPSGVCYVGKNLYRFARSCDALIGTNETNYATVHSALRNVLAGRSRSWKGWTLRHSKEELATRKILLVLALNVRYAMRELTALNGLPTEKLTHARGCLDGARKSYAKVKQIFKEQYERKPTQEGVV